MTSPLALVPIAHQVSGLIESLTNRTELSTTQMMRAVSAPRTRICYDGGLRKLHEGSAATPRPIEERRGYLREG
jgi:hypothetical protein